MKEALIVLTVFALLCLCANARVSDSLTFFLINAPDATGGFGRVLVYTESRQKSEQWPVFLQDPDPLALRPRMHPLVIESFEGLSTKQMHFMTRGKTTRFWGQIAKTDVALTKERVTQLRLQPGLGRNSLWHLYNYATITNLSLTLSHTVEDPTGGAWLACNPQSTSFCELAPVTLSTWPEREALDGTYRIVYDVTRERGLLPPLLYFLLTNGRNSVAHRGNVDNARRVEAITWMNDRFRLADADSDYFEMQVSDERLVVVGSRFFRHNYTKIEIDGVQDRVRFSVNTIAHGDALYAFTAVALVVCIVGYFFFYIRWATSRDRILINQTVDYLRDPALQAGWNHDRPLRLGSFVFAILSPLSLVVAWVSWSVLGNNISTRLTTTTTILYVVNELGLVLSIALRWGDFCGGKKEHAPGIEYLWTRNFFYISSIYAAALLIVAPVVWLIVEEGERLGLFILWFPLLGFVHDLTYQTLGCLCIAFLQRRLVFQRALLVGLIGIAELATLVVVSTLDIVAPAFEHSTSFFSLRICRLGGATLLMLIVFISATGVLSSIRAAEYEYRKTKTE